MDWLTLSSGTNASRDTHGDGAAFNRPGSARSARNSSPPHYDTDPKPAVPSLNDEPGCIKVVDTFRIFRSAAPSPPPPEALTCHAATSRRDTDKQKRQAEHIEEGYENRGVAEDEAELLRLGDS